MCIRDRDHFFNQRTQVFEGLAWRERALLRSIYNLPEHESMLPSIDDTPASESGWPVEVKPRQQRRHSFSCPADFCIPLTGGRTRIARLRIVELSSSGFLAHASEEIPARVWGKAIIHLGEDEDSMVRAIVVRGKVLSLIHI